jgi:hypothetical protein
MGCDIHAVIDYEDECGSICPFVDGQFWIPRDYGLFAALAGVRAEPGEQPLYEPRGLPPRFSDAAQRLLFHVVVDEDDQIPNWLKDADSVSRAEAEKWVRQGDSFYHDSAAKPRGLVSDPGRHTPSWLNVLEVEAALTHLGLKLEDRSAAFRAVVAAMHALSREYGLEKVRLVFCFDS